jgi:dCMP deaminase
MGFEANSKDLVWLEATRHFADGFSKCPRKTFAAILVDKDNQIISLGYNGNIRGQCGDLCGGDICWRDSQNIPSGKETDVGCVHAEENAILNCARQGVSCEGSTLYVNGEPCVKCALRIAQVGVNRVVCYGGQYPQNGLELLKGHGIETQVIPAPHGKD